MSPFRDHIDAGRQLARLAATAPGLGGDGIVVLGLPRGGVPVAAEVGRALGAPLDVIVVRKLGVPFQPEPALGAIGEDGVRVENDRVIGSAALGSRDIESIARKERAELVRRAQRYRDRQPRLDLRGRCAVIVDDGIATGSTARAACLVARAHGASRIVLAVPVAPAWVVAALDDLYDDALCLAQPESFKAVGEWYDDFSPTTDDEVVQLLRGGAQP